MGRNLPKSNASITLRILDKNIDHRLIDQCYSLHQKSQPFPWSQSMFVDMTESPYALFGLVNSKVDLQADAEPRLLGYAVLLTVFDEATLMDIAVEPEWQNKGLGRHILRQVCDHCKTVHVSTLMLEVRQSNENAVQLYSSFGFETVAVRENYYPHVDVNTHNGNEKEHAIIMHKPII